MAIQRLTETALWAEIDRDEFHQIYMMLKQNYQLGVIIDKQTQTCITVEFGIGGEVLGGPPKRVFLKIHGTKNIAEAYHNMQSGRSGCYVNESVIVC